MCWIIAMRRQPAQETMQVAMPSDAPSNPSAHPFRGRKNYLALAGHKVITGLCIVP